jgi:hypothetical protein
LNIGEVTQGEDGSEILTDLFGGEGSPFSGLNRSANNPFFHLHISKDCDFSNHVLPSITYSDKEANDKKDKPDSSQDHLSAPTDPPEEANMDRPIQF